MAQQRPSKGRDIPISRKIEIATEICDLYATNRYNLVDCLRKGGIRSESTWHRWLSEIEEIKTLYKKAIAQKEKKYDDSLSERAMTVFENALEGQRVTLYERTGEITTDDQGNEVMITKGIKEKQIYIPPSLQAAEFILVNLRGNKFSRNPAPDKAGNTKYPEKIDIEVVKSSKPVTREDDITDPI